LRLRFGNIGDGFTVPFVIPTKAKPRGGIFAENRRGRSFDSLRSLRMTSANAPLPPSPREVGGSLTPPVVAFATPAPSKEGAFWWRFLVLAISYMVWYH